MSKKPYQKWKKRLPGVVFLGFWMVYFVYLWLNQFQVTANGIKAGSQGAWADGAVHLTYTAAIYSQDHFPTHLPVYYNHPFTYSFVSDALTTIPMMLGVDIFTSYEMLGIVLSGFFLVSLWWFYRKFFEDSTKAAVAGFIFMLSGGLGFWWFIRDLWMEGPELFLNIEQEYTQIPDAGIHWLNVITGELIPQRAFLLGLPVGLMIVNFLYRQFVGEKVRRVEAVVAGMLYGLLPIVHPHTFIVVTTVASFVFGFGLVDRLLRKKKMKGLVWTALSFGLPAVVIAVPLVFKFVAPSTGDSFSQWFPGWLARAREINWFYFWIVNWGLFIPVSVAGMFFLERKQRLFMMPFLVLFVLSNLILFQPYDWDNSKVLTWVYLVLSLPAAEMVVRLWRSKKRWGVVIGAVLLGLMTFSGGLDAVRVAQVKYRSLPMYSNEDLELAEWVNKNTPTDALVLTSDQHNHPVSSLSGRQILMGYRGWLWTYGINYRPRERDVLLMYSGSEQGLRLVEDYGVDYVVVGPSERRGFRANVRAFEEKYEVVYMSDGYVVYGTNLDHGSSIIDHR